MSSSNFEMVMMGEEGREIKTETELPLLPELCSETGDDFQSLQDEELDIKEEQLDDVDELTNTASEVWSTSPCLSEGELAARDETLTEILEDPLRTTNSRSKTKSVHHRRAQHLQKPQQKKSKLKIIKINSVKPASRASKNNLVLNAVPSVRVPLLIPSEHLSPNLINLSQDLQREEQPRSEEIIFRPIPIPTSSVRNRKKVNNKQKSQVSINQSKNSQQNSVSPNTVHKNMNLTTITGKTICKQEHNVNLDPLAVDYHCMNCNKDYDNPLLLMFHDCPDPKCKFYCKMCPKKFISSKTLQNHIVNKHLDLNIVDNNVEDGPVIHLRRVEEWYTGKIYSPKPNLTCAVCKYVTTSKKSLKLHIKSHFKIKYFKCKFCEARFLTNFNLKMHCKKFHNIQTSKNISGKINTKKINREKEFKCQKCNIKFKTNLALHVHMKSHSNSYKTKPNLDHGKIVKKKYSCNICNEKFNCRSKMDSHIFAGHRRQVLAQFCSQNTNIISDSESDDDSSLACKECDFKCTSKSELQSHANFHLIFKFKCKHCGIFLMNESELDKHLKISHKSEENATLELSVHTEDNVATTIEVDSAMSTNSRRQNITQYPCKYCGKIYVYSSTVEYHQKTQHKEECDAERNPQKFKSTKGKIATKENQFNNKTAVRKARKQNLDLRKDETITVNITCQSPDYLYNNSNQDGNSSGTENNYFSYEEATDFTENNPDSYETNDVEDISCEETSNNEGESRQQLLRRRRVNVESYMCGLCNLKFPIFSQLYKHGEKHHKIVKRNLKLRRTTGSIKCKICSSRYDSKISFRHHMLQHRGILPYQCKYCKKMFGLLKVLTIHENTCSENTNIDNFQGKKLILPFSGTQLFTCNICGLYFSSVLDINEHAQTFHSNIFVPTKLRKGKGGKYKCDECFETFPTIDMFRQHKIVHRGVKAIPCMFCSKIYSNIYIVYGHYKEAHKPIWKLSLRNKAKKLKCHNYMFEGSDYVSLSKIDSEKFMVFTCHKCDITFKTKSEIYQHCNENHNGLENKTFVCSICDIDFITRTRLKNHNRNLHGNKSENNQIYYCNDCAEEFIDFEDLRKHITSSTCKFSLTSKTVEETCTRQKRKTLEPDQIFSRNSKRLKTDKDLCDDEMESVREMQESYEANIEMEFTRSGQHNQKSKQHKGDFENSEIDSRLSDSDNSKHDNFNYESGNEKCTSQNLHSNANHDSSKYFICNLCDIKFYKMKDLFTHGEETHEITVRKIPTQKKISNGPYKCKVCESGYVTLMRLEYHMLQHRNIRAYPCKYCEKTFPSNNCSVFHCKKHHTEKYNADCAEKIKKFLEEDAETGNQNKTNKNILINNNVNTFSHIFSCDICKIYFTNCKYLSKHAEQFHRDNFVQPYVRSTVDGHFKCDECNGSFGKEGLLCQHKLKHRCIKPFPCVFCTTFHSEYAGLHCHYNACHKEEFMSFKRKKLEFKIADPLKDGKKTYMFEGSKYITLTELNNEILSFECHDCKLVFNTRDEALNHCKIKHSQVQGDRCGKSSFRQSSPRQDIPCGETLSSRKALDAHYLSKHESQRLEKCKKKSEKLKAKNVIFEYVCNLCDHRYDSHSKLCKHQQTHFPDLHTDNMTKCETSFYCDDCGQEFVTFDVLKKHITSSVCKNDTKSQEDGGQKRKTIKTGKIEGENSTILKTDRIKFGDLDEISKENTSERQERVENDRIIKKEESRNKCKTKEADSSDSDEIDKRLSDDSQDENFNYSTESESNDSISEDEKDKECRFQSPPVHRSVAFDYACNLCKQQFTSLNDVYVHSEEYHEVTVIKIPTHKKMGTGPNKCTVCGSGFFNVRAMQCHMLAHRNVKPFPCKYCEKSFSSAGSLTFHYDKYHTKMYNVMRKKLLIKKQKAIGRKYKNKTNSNECINNYVNSYSQIYSCNICKIYYLNVKYLIEHTNKYHSGNFYQPQFPSINNEYYKCDECEGTFTRKCRLTYHKLKHRNLKIHPCLFCKKFYTDFPGLYYHYKACHEIQWNKYKLKQAESKITQPLQNVNKTFMFEGSKYITLTEINKNVLSFECHLCKLVFDTRDEAIDHNCASKHFGQLNGGKANVDCCKFCRKTFTSSRALNAHYCSIRDSHRLEDKKRKSETVEVENVIIEFCCHLCDRKFDNHSELNKHQQILHDMHIESVTKLKGPFYCDDCGEEFVTFDVLKKHITSSACKNEIDSDKIVEVGNRRKRKMFQGKGRNNSEKLKISKVGFDYSSDDENLKLENQGSCTEHKLFTCNDCNSSFDTKLKLETHIERHIKYHHNRVEKLQNPLTCRLCNKTFKMLSSVKSHLCSNVPRIYTCVVCKETFQSKHLYVLHKTTHEKEFVCETCGDGFFTEFQLKLHNIRRHEERKFLCSLCGSKFAFISNLNMHLKRHEKAEYSCKGCDKKFFTLKQSQQHYNTVHSDVCLFCKTCSQSFTRKDHLDEHERLHDQTNKKFKCEFCNKTFNSHSGHKFHVLKSHKVS